MFALSPGTFLALGLFAFTVEAAEPLRASKCSAAPRIDLTAEPVEQKPDVCVNLDEPTTFVFEVPLPAGAVMLSDNTSMGFAQGDNFVTVYPKRIFRPGDRTKLMVRFGDDAVPESAIFWLEGYAANGARRVEVFRHLRSADVLERDAADARAEARQCQEEKSRLIAERRLPRGLMGVAWLEQGEVIHSEDIFNDLKHYSTNMLTAEGATIYTHTGGVAMRLKLLNLSATPWTADSAMLKDSLGSEVRLSSWQEVAISPNAFGFVVVGTERDPVQIECPCVLTLWETQGLRTVTIENVTFSSSSREAGSRTNASPDEGGLER